jgi:hypothetical protein
MILEISGYVLASGHYTLIRERPRWLAPFFVSIAAVYTVLHVPLQTMRGYYSGKVSILAFLDALCLIALLIITLTVIDVIFWRIRKIVIASDAAASSTTKMLPRLMKIGRIVGVLNVALVGAQIFVLFQNRTPTSAPAQASAERWTLSTAPLIRLVVLLITMWWTFHPPCPKARSKSQLGQLSSRTTRSATGHESSTSRPSSSCQSSSSSSGNSAASAPPPAATAAGPFLTIPGSAESTSGDSPRSSALPRASAETPADSPRPSAEPISEAPLGSIAVEIES